MVSFTRILNRTGDDTVMRKVVLLLLEKIASGAAVADEAECQAFQADIRGLRDCMAAEASPETMLLTAGSATQALETYNKAITRILRRQGSELQNIINMMSKTVATIAAESHDGGDKLREIGDRLERTNSINDLDTLKSHVSECLMEFREETLRQKEQNDGLITELRQEIKRGFQKTALSESGSLDPATGFPTREACVNAMNAVIPAGKRRYVATVVASRLQSVNARFGHEIGDEFLRRLGKSIEQKMLPSDKLFRWSGPAFVLLLESGETLDEVRIRIKKNLESKVDDAFNLRGRSVIIPISADWAAFRLLSATMAEGQIQTFIASQGGRELV